MPRLILRKGKGYPDVATRELLRLMSASSPMNGFQSPPVFALVDFDPDGLAILDVYTNGSTALASETYRLAVPGIRRIGLGGEHIRGVSQTDSGQGLLPLSRRDRRKAISMLGHESTTDGHSECARRHDLQLMLMLGFKAELEILDEMGGSVDELLTQSLPPG